MLKLLLTLACVVGMILEVTGTSKTNCTKPNEQYEICPETCPFRTCGIDDRLIDCIPSPRPGDPDCPPPKCRCKNQFFRDDKGNCVPWEKCPKCTKPNEMYDPCDNPCPGRRCDVDPRVIKCAAPPKIGDENCLVGCRCKDGYLRNDKGVCVPKDKCPKKCNKNEIFDPCPDCSPQTCGTVNEKFNCPLIPADTSDPKCIGACRCKEGYARDNNGECVPIDFCTKCKGPDEVYDTCPDCSPQTCETRDKIYNCPKISAKNCKPACRCKNGFFRNKLGQCISAENCAKCPGEHEYWSCGVACDNVCGKKYGQDNCNIINIKCNEKCYCEKDYARATNGTCIPKKDCQYNCPKNERYEECPSGLCTPKTCSEAGFKLNCTIRSEGDPCPGKPGCVCEDGYLRDCNGICIPSEECPSCGGDKNSTLGCGVNCGRLCSNYDSKDPIFCIQLCRINACDCRPDYVLDSNTGQCVLPKDCTVVCKKNEVYSKCANGCGKKYCSDLNKPDRCKDERSEKCKDGCVCAKGYLRDGNGVCIPIDKCSKC